MCSSDLIRSAHDLRKITNTRADDRDFLILGVEKDGKEFFVIHREIDEILIRIQFENDLRGGRLLGSFVRTHLIRRIDELDLVVFRDEADFDL